MQMNKILGFDFQMYPLSGTTFSNVGGLYVVHTPTKWLDVGQTSDFGARLANHDRQPDWLRNAAFEPIFISVLRLDDETTRLAVEIRLRANLQPICGDR